MEQALTKASKIGVLIAARRRALGLSQRQLAAKLGISQNYLSQIEAEQRKLSAERLLDLANVLGLELVIRDKQQAPDSDW